MRSYNKDFRNVEALKNNVYGNKAKYEGFGSISSEKYNEILELANNFNPVDNNYYFQNSKLEKYFSCLEYVRNSYEFNYRLFDEKILFIILCCDKDLVHLREFETAKIMNRKKVLNAESPEEKAYLNSIRNKQISDYESSVRSKIGFYYVDLIKYEKDYLNKILKRDSFNYQAKEDYTQRLLRMVNEIDTKNLNSIALENANKAAMSWISGTNNITTNVISNNIINQFDLFGFKNIEEALLCYLLVIDPELKALKIYEEESNLKKMKPRFKYSLGFYNSDLIKLEKIYHSIYCPNLELSEWTMTK